MNALLGRAAPPGSTIGVVTPGSPPETRAEVERGIAWWESSGYRVKLMPGALEQEGWHAGSPEVRARDLQAAFADPEVDAIQTMRGGYGSAQVIPVLAGETTGRVPEDRDRLTVVSIAGGTASGRLVGGCLVDFIYTLGTPWEPDLEDALFFFEDCNHAPIQIDRALLYLEQVGKLEGVRGVVVGELAGCEWYEHTSFPRSKTLEDVLEDRLGRLGVPVLYGLPLGHGATLATLPLGVEATLDADARTLTIDAPALVAP